MIRMYHPEHGYHHAYSIQEESTMRLNGWINDVDLIIEQEEDAQEEFAVEQVRVKRGRQFKQKE